MANLISIGVTGLIAHQSAINTTGNNITNANIPGYSRQRVEFGTLPEQLMGPGYLGAGVQVQGIERVVEQFLINQLRLDTANFNSVDTKAALYKELDSLLADTSTGVAPAVQQLFATLQQAAQDPTSLAVRQVVLNDAGILSQRFNSLYSMLQNQQQVANQQLDALVGQVNSLAGGIAQMNQSIAEATNANGAEPNALLDKRDEMVRQLAELVGVKAVPDTSTGFLNVFIGNGQPLVVGNRANTLATTPSLEDPSVREIVFSSGTVQQPISQFLSGGKIGGLLDYRDEGLVPAMNELGRIAVTFADALNQQQRLGLDLDGNFGNSLFTDINSATAMQGRALGSENNTGAASMDVYIDDTSALTGQDYRLSFTSATAYELLDANGRSLTPPQTGTLGAVPATIATPDGFEIRVGAGSTFAAGDIYRIQPTRLAAREVSVALNNPRGLAFSQPVVTGASSLNTGRGTISAGAMLSVYQADGTTVQSTFATPNALTPPILVRFTSPTGYEVLDNTNPAAPVALAPPVTGTILPGQPNTVTINDPVSGDPVYSFDIAGYPASGDSFTVGYNLNGSSDNRNAVALGDLRLTDMVGGSLTVEEAYGALVARVGSTTASLIISSEAADSLLAQAQASRDAVSGVNLDEEAANLIRFEQAYNASAQVINIARSLFDTMLAAVSR